jgi:hypothetical protein
MPGNYFQAPANSRSARAREATRAANVPVPGTQIRHRRWQNVTPRVGSFRPGSVPRRPGSVPRRPQHTPRRRGRRRRTGQPTVQGQQSATRFRIVPGLGQAHVFGIPLLLKRLADELRNNGGRARFLAAINSDEVGEADRQLLGELCSAYPTAAVVNTALPMDNNDTLSVASVLPMEIENEHLPIAQITQLGGKKTKRRRKKKTRKKKTKRRKKKTKRKKRHLKKRTRKRRR